MRENFNDIKYSILDPTGNITALVESEVAAEQQPAAAEAVMKRHTEVEQVGFVRFDPEEGINAHLRMAGGEFCGNASLCTAALYLMRKGDALDGEGRVLALRVSGADSPVSVRIKREQDSRFYAGISMPEAIALQKKELYFGNEKEMLTVVRMQGISHILIDDRSCFFSLREDRISAENAVKKWCGELSAEGLGLMFINKGSERFDLTPLVYIPGSNTVFWENSCASGSAAAGIALTGAKNDLTTILFREPGGELLFKKVPEKNENWLYGSVRCLHLITP